MSNELDYVAVNRTKCGMLALCISSMLFGMLVLMILEPKSLSREHEILHRNNPGVYYFVGLPLSALTIAAMLSLFLLPSFVAWRFNHSCLLSIFVLNVLFGMLVVPWVLLLLWAQAPVAFRAAINANKE